MVFSGNGFFSAKDCAEGAVKRTAAGECFLIFCGERWDGRNAIELLRLRLQGPFCTTLCLSTMQWQENNAARGLNLFSKIVRIYSFIAAPSCYLLSPLFCASMAFVHHSLFSSAFSTSCKSYAIAGRKISHLFLSSLHHYFFHFSLFP